MKKFLVFMVLICLSFSGLAAQESIPVIPTGKWGENLTELRVENLTEEYIIQSTYTYDNTISYVIEFYYFNERTKIRNGVLLFFADKSNEKKQYVKIVEKYGNNCSNFLSYIRETLATYNDFACIDDLPDGWTCNEIWLAVDDIGQMTVIR